MPKFEKFFSPEEQKEIEEKRKKSDRKLREGGAEQKRDARGRFESGLDVTKEQIEGAREEMKQDFRERIEKLKEEIETTEKQEKEKEPGKEEKPESDPLQQRLELLTIQIQEMKEKGASREQIREKTEEIRELLDRRKELAEKITDRNLEEEARQELKQEHGARYRTVRKKDYIKEKLETITEKRREASYKKRWQELPRKQQRHIYGNFEEFVDQMNERRKETQQEIGLEISEDIFCAMLNLGYKPEDIKKKGLFRKKIAIPRRGEKPLKVSAVRLREIIEHSKKKIAKGREERAEELFLKARHRARREKGKLIEERIKEVVSSPEEGEKYRELAEDYIKEKEEEKEEKAEERTKESSTETEPKEEKEQEIVEETEQEAEKSLDQSREEAKERYKRQLESLRTWKREVETEFEIDDLENYTGLLKGIIFKRELRELAKAWKKKTEEIEKALELELKGIEKMREVRDQRRREELERF